MDGWKAPAAPDEELVHPDRLRVFDAGIERIERGSSVEVDRGHIVPRSPKLPGKLFDPGCQAQRMVKQQHETHRWRAYGQAGNGSVTAVGQGKPERHAANLGALRCETVLRVSHP